MPYYHPPIFYIIYCKNWKWSQYLRLYISELNSKMVWFLFGKIILRLSSLSYKSLKRVHHKFLTCRSTLSPPIMYCTTPVNLVIRFPTHISLLLFRFMPSEEEQPNFAVITFDIKLKRRTVFSTYARRHFQQNKYKHSFISTIHGVRFELHRLNYLNIVLIWYILTSVAESNE